MQKQTMFLLKLPSLFWNRHRAKKQLSKQTELQIRRIPNKELGDELLKQDPVKLGLAQDLLMVLDKFEQKD